MRPASRHVHHAAFLAFAGLVACAPEPGGAADFELHDVGLRTPESVLHDPVADIYLVSNIAGDPFAHDGEGFISRIAPDGKVVDLRWIDGGKNGVTLDAPKGLALTTDHLWVADLDHVRRFDRRSGAPLGDVKIDGATFLNDVAVGPDGAIWVTDSGFLPGFEPSGSDAIWRVDSELHATVVCASSKLGHPNGIAAGSRDMFCVNWADGVFSLVGADGLVAPATLPAAQLDGLVRTPDGRWLISSWAGRCVYELAPDGTATVRIGELDAPADIGFDALRGRVLIPSFTADRLIARKL